MTQQPEGRASQAYELFILVLTIVSLIVMVVMLLPLSDAVIGMLQFYDNLICLIFLIDFAIRLRRAHPRSAYFIGERGWLDLLGSIPSFGVAFRYSDATGKTDSAACPNGAQRNIAGIVNETGRVLGMMPHPERLYETVLGGTDGRRVFESILLSTLEAAA